MLHGANLQAANLQLTIIRETEFTGTDLAMARLNGAFVASARLDLSDLRSISLEQPAEADVKRVLDSLRYLQSFPNFLPPVLIDYLQDPNAPARVAGDRLEHTRIDADVLCDAATPLDEKQGRSRCLGENEIDRYVDRLAAFACEHDDVAFGLSQRALRWADSMWLARFYHRGRKPDAYPRLLAERLLQPDCEAGARLPAAIIDTLQGLVETNGAAGRPGN
jgi:hypothetical protein